MAYKSPVIRLPWESRASRQKRDHVLFRTLNPHGGRRPVTHALDDVSGHEASTTRTYQPSDIQQRHRNLVIFGKPLTNREAQERYNKGS